MRVRDALAFAALGAAVAMALVVAFDALRPDHGEHVEAFHEWIEENHETGRFQGDWSGFER